MNSLLFFIKHPKRTLWNVTGAEEGACAWVLMYLMHDVYRDYLITVIHTMDSESSLLALSEKYLEVMFISGSLPPSDAQKLFHLHITLRR